MTPETILERATADGVRLTLSDAGKLKVAGNAAAVNPWLTTIKENRDALAAILSQTQTAWGWSVTYPGGRYLEIFCVPESTRAEIQAQHPGAVVDRIADEDLP